MSELDPNAPPGFVWCFLDIDITICRDFIRFEEAKLGHEMSNDEAINFISKEFHFSRNRAKQIIDTIKGEMR